MFFRVQHGKRVIAESEHGGPGGIVGGIPSENDATVAEVQAIEKTEGEVADGIFRGRGLKRVGDGHVRRIREISGREIRCRAR